MSKMPYLTELQAAYLPAIEWLISDAGGDRATGRSTLLCHALIRRAIKTGRPVRIFDHVAGQPHNIRYCARLIAQIVKEHYSDYHYTITFSEHLLMVKARAADLPDWSVGMVVRLQSGGPNMTISQVQQTGDVQTRWFADSDLRSGWFRASDLVKVSR